MMEPDDYQQRVRAWTLRVFPADTADNLNERALRFLEEAAELAQAIGLSESQAVDLIRYVWARPKGEASLEVGGVMVTLAALCAAHGVSMTEEAEREYVRINTPEVIARVQRRQHEKRAAGFAVPEPRE